MDLLHNPEFFVAIGFVVVVVLFLWKGRPIVGKMLDDRASIIRAELDEARRLREEAAALLADYKRKAANAEKEAEAIVTEARADAERFSAESRAVLSAQIARRAQQATDKIAQAETAALNEIRASAADAAVAAAEKLIASKLNEQKASGLISQSIADVGGKLN